MGTPSEQLRACADFLIEHADELTGHLFNRCTGICVHINMTACQPPTVTVEREFMPVHSITVNLPNTTE